MNTIIVSKTDPAGMNISKFLLDDPGFKETGRTFDSNPIHEKDDFQLVFLNDSQIHADKVNDIETEALIFASLHRAESKKPSLTVHALGNWGKAEFGGKPGELVPTSGSLIKNYLMDLQKKKEALGLDYEVSLECTHHGPFLTKPAVFIELGSSKEQWNDLSAAKAIAETIMESTSLEGPYTNAIGVGGGHYCPEFTKLVLRTSYTLSHIIPKYALANINQELVSKAINSSTEKITEIVVDYKGFGTEKARIMPLLESTGLPVKRVRKLL